MFWCMSHLMSTTYKIAGIALLEFLFLFFVDSELRQPSEFLAFNIGDWSMPTLTHHHLEGWPLTIFYTSTCSFHFKMINALFSFWKQRPKHTVLYNCNLGLNEAHSSHNGRKPLCDWDWNSKFNPFFVVVVVFGTFNSNQSNYVFVFLFLIFPNLGYSKLCFWYIYFTTMWKVYMRSD